MARERIEDLGRLMVKIDNILEHDLFTRPGNNGVYCYRIKDFPSVFHEFDKEKQTDWVMETLYGIDSVKESLYECLEISKGEDTLNEREHD